jgi:hypothetical protein
VGTRIEEEGWKKGFNQDEKEWLLALLLNLMSTHKQSTRDTLLKDSTTTTTRKIRELLRAVGAPESLQVATPHCSRDLKIGHQRSTQLWRGQLRPFRLLSQQQPHHSQPLESGGAEAASACRRPTQRLLQAVPSVGVLQLDGSDATQVKEVAAMLLRGAPLVGALRLGPEGFGLR